MTTSNNKLLQQALYIIAISAIIIFSFFSFSEAYYPLLNSDGALNILMTHTFSLPKDLYCWGQDRVGSLIPLIGHILMKLSGMSTVWACSLAHYFTLIVGYFFFSLMFRSKFIRLIFAVAWFFPPWHMVDFVLFSFNTPFIMIAMMIYLISKIFVDKNSLKRPLQIFYVILICGLAIASVWVSDLSFLSIVILILFILYRYYSNHEGTFFNKSKSLASSVELYVVILMSVIGFLFIYYAKTHAVKSVLYNENMMNSFSEVMKSLGFLLTSIFDMLCFRSEKILMGVYVYAVIIATVIIALCYKKSQKQKKEPAPINWALFFLINAVLSFLLLMFSHWVFLNGVGRRYFTVIYISLWLAFLFYADRRSLFRNKAISISIITIAFISVFCSVFSFYYPKRMKPAVEVAAEFKTLGNIGIIADYWNSYINACPDPDMIKATPNDKDSYRNEKIIDDVFEQPAIYVIRDMWMKSFPDTLEQFGYTLKRKGQEFFIGGCYTCQYEKVKTHKIFYLADLKTNKGKIITDSASSLKVLIADSIDSDNYNALQFGPFIHLGKGKFEVTFHLKTKINSKDAPLATLDVSNDWGKEIIAKKYVHTIDFKNPGSFENIKLNFDAVKRLGSVEFRITYTGRSQLSLDYIELKQL